MAAEPNGREAGRTKKDWLFASAAGAAAAYAILRADFLASAMADSRLAPILFAANPIVAAIVVWMAFRRASAGQCALVLCAVGLWLAADPLETAGGLAFLAGAWTFLLLAAAGRAIKARLEPT